MPVMPHTWPAVILTRKPFCDNPFSAGVRELSLAHRLFVFATTGYGSVPKSGFESATPTPTHAMTQQQAPAESAAAQEERADAWSATSWDLPAVPTHSLPGGSQVSSQVTSSQDLPSIALLSVHISGSGDLHDCICTGCAELILLDGQIWRVSACCLSNSFTLHEPHSARKWLRVEIPGCWGFDRAIHCLINT